MKIRIRRSELFVIDRARELIRIAFQTFKVVPWTPIVLDMEAVLTDSISSHNFQSIRSWFDVQGRFMALDAIIRFQLKFTLVRKNGSDEYRIEDGCDAFSLVVFISERKIEMVIGYDTRKTGSYNFVYEDASREFLAAIDRRIEEERARRALG